MSTDCCNCYCRKNGLRLPNKNLCIYPDDIVILGRFSTVRWKVGFGWFSYEGNRKICGWYLTNLENRKIVKPVQETDLDDIYTIQSC